MGFETVVLSVVSDVVRHAKAEFAYGTMFVSNITEDESNRILNNLNHFFNTTVIVHKTGVEYAYDFV